MDFSIRMRLKGRWNIARDGPRPLGTPFYFVLFNLGLIALTTPVQFDPLVRNLEWPFLILVTLVAPIFLSRGVIGRIEGGMPLLAYAVYVDLHIAFR